MVSTGGGRSLFRTILVVIIVILVLLQNPCVGVLGSDQTVTVSLYYETLCPYCADFIVNHLVKLFQNGLISIVNLRLIPWGNAWINPDGSFACQVPHHHPLLPFILFFNSVLDILEYDVAWFWLPSLVLSLHCVVFENFFEAAFFACKCCYQSKTCEIQWTKFEGIVSDLVINLFKKQALNLLWT